MMDFVLEAWVSAIIESKRASWMMGGGTSWHAGEKLKLLFAGYNGTRNMGSDVRVEEMLRQLRHILGADKVDFSVMTQTFARSQGYFADTRQVLLPQIFPPFLSSEVPQHHGVVACEGSMFKSKFANALTTMMIGSLGIAAVQNKLSVGYGAEAGHMDPIVERHVCALLQGFADHHAQRRIPAPCCGNLACPLNSVPIPPGHSNLYRLSTDSASFAELGGMAARRYWWSAQLIPSSGRSKLQSGN